MIQKQQDNHMRNSGKSINTAGNNLHFPQNIITSDRTGVFSMITKYQQDHLKGKVMLHIFFN